MTLAHFSNTAWADSATDNPAHHGLTPFGVEVVREMNRLGMMVDLSHVSADTMKAALTVSRAPVIFSHSSVRALVDHPRNVPDDVLRLVAANGGVVMVNFYPGYVSNERRLWGTDRVANRRAWGSTPPFAGLFIGQPERAAAALTAWEHDHPKPIATLGQVADHIEYNPQDRRCGSRRFGVRLRRNGGNPGGPRGRQPLSGTVRRAHAPWLVGPGRGQGSRGQSAPSNVVRRTSGRQAARFCSAVRSGFDTTS